MSRTFKKLSTLGVACMGLAVFAMPAQASHRMSQDRAEARAKVEAKAFFRGGDDYYTYSCPQRKSSQEFRCIAAAYDNDSNKTNETSFRVTFANARSNKTVAGAWYACTRTSGDTYNMAGGR